MKKGRLLGSLAAVLVLVTAVLVWMGGLGARPRLGLDLRGGISVILSPVAVEGTEVPDDVLDQTIEIIRNRVDSLGVAEPEIARQGDDILVQLPGIEDRERALEIIGKTARLDFRPVQQLLPPGDPQYDQGPDCTLDSDEPTIPEPDATATTAPDATATTAPDTTATTTPDTTPTAERSPQAAAAGRTAAAAAAVRTVAAASAQPSPAPSPTGAAGTPSPSPSPTGDTAQPGQGQQGGEKIVCGEPVDDDPDTDEDESALPPLKYRTGPPALGGEDVADALATVEQTQTGGFTNNWIVQLDLTDEGAQKFAQITGELACRRDQGDPGGGQLAIVLDDVVESAPSMNPDVQCNVGIAGGEAVITVGGSEQEARDLALVLRTGALPITLEPSTAFNVSPTLGARSLRAGIVAGLIGLALVAAYMTAFYRWLGALAFGGLMVFGTLIVGLITLLGEAGFTLTLAGIAGVIVSVGIAADSSILYFERIRDELDTGKTVRTSVHRAFRPAFRTNLTGNTVTIAAAIILYFLAVGPVRGFAFTLGLSTALDLLILYFFTRPAVQLMGRTRLLGRRTVHAATEPQIVGGAR
ncbi:MAG TPA: protein translocase subunit SecD [Nitriliruptorales bacterium]|nr:protein translocase subunit SecD [Nitriliruptorales bacterium]